MLNMNMQKLHKKSMSYCYVVDYIFIRLIWLHGLKNMSIDYVKYFKYIMWPSV